MLPAGVTVDLTTVAPVPADITGELAAWTSAVNATQQNVNAAQAAQAAAEAARNAAISVGVPTPTTAGHVLTALTSSTFGWAAPPAGTGSDPLKANLASPTFTGTVGGITKSMVGLANADNTTDANKPVSTATQTALNAKAALAAGVPGPTTTGQVLTALTTTTFGWAAPTAAAGSDPLKANLESPTFTGIVGGVTKSMVGLANVDNTTDANKPVSSATVTALALKSPLASPTFTGTVSGVTRAMVGLANVDNTSDVNKTVSTATQTALNGKVNIGDASTSTNSVKTPTTWAASTAYGVGDYFSTTTGVIYRVVVAHTSGTVEPGAATANFTVWGSSANLPGSVTVRNSLGEVAFNAVYANNIPTATTELTNKLYVDNQISTITVPAQPFVFYPIVWSGTAWTYGNVAITARPSGMRPGDIAFFDGVGTLPTWATTNDLMTEG
jgi:hypothetical protein